MPISDTQNFTQPDPKRKPNALEDVGKTFRDNRGGYEPRPNELYYGGTAEGADEDVARARQRAEAASQRGAYQTDLSRFDQSRGETNTALGLQRDAAMGNAPSRAEIAGKAAMDRSLQSQVAAAGSTRGGPANTAAGYRNAAVNAAGQRAQMTQGIQAERAGEMAQARGQYGQTALGAQSQDLGAAGLQQQSELTQRGLNQGQEQFYENQGQRTREQELDANLRRRQMENERFATSRAQTGAESESNRQETKDIFSTAIGAIGGLFSDITSKAMKSPAGLGALGFGGLPSAKSGPSAGPGEATSGPSDPTSGPYTGYYSDERTKNDGGDRGVAGAPKGYAKSRAGQAGSMFNPPAGQTEGASKLAPGSADFARYGGDMDLKATSPEWSAPPKTPDAAGPNFFGMLGGANRGMLSDARAKEEAYNLGRAHQMESAATGKPPEGGFEYETKGDVQDKRINKSKPKEGKSEGARALIIDKPRTASVATWSRPTADGQQTGAVVPAPPPPNVIDARGSRPGAPPVPVAAPPPAQPQQPGVLGRLGGMFSDERAKRSASSEQDFAEANRSMAAKPYAYKPEFRPPEQGEGEVNVGPMAQTMAKSPVARTAIKKDPETDLLTIDRDKGMKVVMGGIASLQKQLDALTSRGSTKKKEKR